MFSTLTWPSIALSTVFNVMVDTHEYFILPEGAILLPTQNNVNKFVYDLLISYSFQPTHEEGGYEIVSCLVPWPELWRKARSGNNYT